jgi:hypothetical protein
LLNIHVKLNNPIKKTTERKISGCSCNYVFEIKFVLLPYQLKHVDEMSISDQKLVASKLPPTKYLELVEEE